MRLTIILICLLNLSSCMFEKKEAIAYREVLVAPASRPCTYLYLFDEPAVNL